MKTQKRLWETVLGIFVIQHTGFQCFFRLVCALNLSFRPELKYTFEVLKKIIMGLDGNKLSNKVLKTELPQ
uniref:Uncharacterized protein n=1 Tax=Oryzias melastigma TaxID=30732 RepID=A0A3B3DUL4_ORYME